VHVSRLTQTVITEEELVRARAGDAAARARLYALLAPATFTLIRRLLGQRALCEDIFQDTMMLMFERLPQYRGEAPLGAWLRQIAISRCLMYLRSPWQRCRLSLERMESGDTTPVILVTPGYRCEQIDVERALASLAPTARAVVWMYEVEGYSHEEIAQAFGRSISFSKSQLSRAHARLRAWFEPETGGTPCRLI
jgi:RNA polymerase sigma factor (sigma-70 family)